MAHGGCGTNFFHEHTSSWQRDHEVLRFLMLKQDAI